MSNIDLDYIENHLKVLQPIADQADRQVATYIGHALRRLEMLRTGYRTKSQKKDVTNV